MKRLAVVLFAAILTQGAVAATGFYRVEREADGRWWTYTPWNERFVPMGVDHVNSWGFVGANGKWAYKENVLAKYGTVKDWGDETLKRLKSWNFNLLGANSDPEIRYRGVLPYTIFIGLGQCFAGRGGECAIEWKGGRFPNVFHPDFEPAVRRQAREFCQANPKNTTLFGYFIDNELAWRGVGVPDNPDSPPGNRATGLYDAVAALSATNSAKRALVRFVGNRTVTDAVKTEFLEHIAERYFKVASEAIRAVDPNHLVLGSRFAGWEGAHEVVWRAAGRHCDVVSVNLYPHVDPMTGKLTDWNGKTQIPFREVLDPLQACARRPVMVTEWSFPALDAGLPCERGGGQRQPTQHARTVASETCLKTFLATPYIIGHSFFAWPDQSADAPGENCNYGLVNLKSEPYAELTEMFTRLQADSVALHRKDAAATPVAAPVDFAKPDLMPIPMKMTYDAKTAVRFGPEQTIAVTCPDEGAAVWCERHMREWFGFSPRIVRVEGDVSTIKAEGFRLVARPDGISIVAKDLQGVRYAAYALRQAVERESVGETVRGYRLPALEIDDCPRFTFRGLHVAWFPETTGDFIERTIRLAAYYRFNYLVLESFGVFKSERHPWFSRPESPMTVAEIRRLVAVAKDLGLTLVPQLQIFGHSTFARGRSGKHNVLDTHPERASLFEPGNGFVWCLSNPDARRIVVDLVDELHEAFGRPPYMHVGCDEADVPSCAACRARPYTELFFSHFTAVSDHLRAKGARTMMWHDMLLKAGDPRWKGFQANGTAETEALLSRLPKDVVICDWHYGKSDHQESEPATRPTLDHFKASGLDVLACPWDDPVASMHQGRYAARIGLFGVMGTLWHHYRGRAFAETVMAQACAAWAATEAPQRGYYGTLAFCNHWRQIGWDMKSGNYRDTGLTDDQVMRSILAE